MNILSIDVEDYFMVTALEPAVKRSEWDRYESRVERNTCRLLEILGNTSAANSSANLVGTDAHRPLNVTFFCLGWVAEKFPRLIREIHACGHEIACHGYDHRRINYMSQHVFRQDIRRTKALLEDCSNEQVIGYRAPSYSITANCLWAFEILSEEGFLYDSSIFPVRHDLYGFPDAPRYPSVVAKDGRGVRFMPLNSVFSRLARPVSKPSEPHLLVEFPPSTVRLFGQNVPVAGGGYFRFFPMSFTRWAVNRIRREEDLPFIFYLHPWEIDPRQPRVRGIPLKSRFRHYLNLGKTEGRLKSLLRMVPFTSFRDYLKEEKILSHEDTKAQRRAGIME
jgi:polysaccharide deacetylase family protein (PEP-CTERM system associated)